MDLEVEKINRTVEFLFAQVFDDQDTTGKNNTWFYDRAPDGYKFILHSIEISTAKPLLQNNGIFAMYDGHEFTHWQQWPGVESSEILARLCFSDNVPYHNVSLNNWECKEFTIGIRSASDSDTFKVCIVVWYFLEKMNDLETKYYAVTQPRSEHYKKGGPTTLTEGEETV